MASIEPVAGTGALMETLFVGANSFARFSFMFGKGVRMNSRLHEARTPGRHSREGGNPATLLCAVIAAKAGTHVDFAVAMEERSKMGPSFRWDDEGQSRWIPAFAGMTA